MEPNLASRERDRLAEIFPTLTLDTSRIPARVTGIMWIEPELGFSIDLEVPESYPLGIPKLRCNAREIPWEIDRHVLRNGIACLCVTSEYNKHWPPGSDLTDFLTTLIQPYLIAQAYYQDHGRWPSGHERSHGATGVFEAFTDLLAPLGSVSHIAIVNFMLLLARKTHPKGHESCPCGSRTRLRNCHRSLLMALRQTVNPEHVQADLRLLAYYQRQGEHSIPPLPRRLHQRRRGRRVAHTRRHRRDRPLSSA